MSEANRGKERKEQLDRLQKDEQTTAQESKKQGRERALELARKQGAKPIRSMSELKADFWPEEESIDDFLSWVRALRQADKSRSIPE